MNIQSTRRTFLGTGIAWGASLAMPARQLGAAAANSQINLGVIGVGGRGNELARAFQPLKGVNIAGLCDPDETHTAEAKKKYPKAKTWVDLREMIDSPDIDVVAIAACNHWHALAAIWAMQAGKEVYVEKPLANTLWEGRQVVAAADQLGRVCQVGTQQRSDPMQAEVKQFLHEDQALGKVTSVRVNRYGVRAPIGKRQSPLDPPASVNYDLWLGPARDEPIYRDNLHYDWHWVWNTGAGEMGNWGVHILDDVRNVVFLDKVAMPSHIIGGGARAAWDDAGETPNVHFAQFDADGVPVVIALTNLAAKPGSDRSPSRPGPGSGYIAYCEGGRLEGQRASAQAFDKNGALIREFRGDSGMGHHQRNFLAAVEKRDPSILNASPVVGHHSTGWCHLANVAFQVGDSLDAAKADAVRGQSEELDEVLSDFRQLLKAHNAEAGAALQVSSLLDFDPAVEQFTGDAAKSANGYLTREFRKPYVVPEIAQPAAQSAQASS